MKRHISPALVKEILSYDEKSGKLYWKKRGYPAFDNRWAGKEAFVTQNEKGYKTGRLFDREPYKAHRVVWVWWYGEWPEGEIDHINRVKDDNRIENLRVTSSSENSRNIALTKKNLSGCFGVSKHGNKWRARICAGVGEVIELGVYEKKEDAIAARKLAEARYGYHANHGGK